MRVGPHHDPPESHLDTWRGKDSGQKKSWRPEWLPVAPLRIQLSEGQVPESPHNSGGDIK